MELITHGYYDHNYIYSYSSLGLGFESGVTMFKNSIFDLEAYLFSKTDSVILLWK